MNFIQFSLFFCVYNQIDLKNKMLKDESVNLKSINSNNYKLEQLEYGPIIGTGTFGIKLLPFFSLLKFFKKCFFLIIKLRTCCISKR